ncbi:hypothetical protein N9L68_05145, partial [bacterium]|nr:hypothetical protein [bacterium]
EPSTGATQLIRWTKSVELAITPVHPQLASWWNWVLQEVERAHNVFLKTSWKEEFEIPMAPVPSRWLPIEAKI